MQKRMDIIVSFCSLGEQNTKWAVLWRRVFDQAAFFVSECAGVGVPRGHRWEVRQCGRNLSSVGVDGRRGGAGAESEKCASAKPQGD